MSDVLAKYNSAISAYQLPLDDMKRNLLESLFTFFTGILEDKYSAGLMVFFDKTNRRTGEVACTPLNADQVIYLQYIIDGIKRKI